MLRTVLCTVFPYAQYTKVMEKITGFGMKDCLSLPRLGWKYFISLGQKEMSLHTFTMTSIRDAFFDKV